MLNEQTFKDMITVLKKKAPDYPNFHAENTGGYLWVTCMVTFEYQGRQFRRHLVESAEVRDSLTLPPYSAISRQLIEIAKATLQPGSAHPNHEDEEITTGPDQWDRERQEWEAEKKQTLVGPLAKESLIHVEMPRPKAPVIRMRVPSVRIGDRMRYIFDLDGLIWDMYMTGSDFQSLCTATGWSLEKEVAT